MRFDDILAHPILGESVSTLHFTNARSPVDNRADLQALVAVLNKAQGRVSSLNIDLSALPLDISPWQKLAIEDSHSVKSALRNLKRLRVRYGSRDSDLEPDITDLANLANLLAALMHSEKLESLELDLKLWAFDPGSLPGRGVLKTQTVYPNLSTLVLCGVAVQCSALERILNSTNSTSGMVRLKGVHLVDNSWVPILEILRERHSLAVLISPSGAECEDMTVETFQRIFGPYYRSNETIETEADRYIRAKSSVNPLLASDELASGNDLDSDSPVDSESELQSDTGSELE